MKNKQKKIERIKFCKGRCPCKKCHNENYKFLYVCDFCQERYIKQITPPPVPQTSSTPEKKILALFGYSLDYSVRPQMFKRMEDAVVYSKKYEDIAYFIVAFEVNGKVWTDLNSL